MKLAICYPCTRLSNETYRCWVVGDWATMVKIVIVKIVMVKIILVEQEGGASETILHPSKTTKIIKGKALTQACIRKFL